MDERRFLTELEYELRALGTDGDVIKKRIVQFEKYFSTLSADEIAETLEEMGDVTDVAQNIKALSGSGAKKSTPQEVRTEEDIFADVPDAVEDGETVEDSVKDSVGSSGELDAMTENIFADALKPYSGASRIDEAQDRPSSDDNAQEEQGESFFDELTFTAPDDGSGEKDAEDDFGAPEDETKFIDINALREASRDGQLPGADEAFAQTISIDTTRLAPEEKAAADKDIAPRHIELDFNELDMGETELKPTARGQAVFIVGAILTLPITLPLLLVVLALIGGTFAAISVLIAALIALLVAVVIGGVAIPLIGIIFGIVKAYTVFSAGLYEIGLGIAVAGCAMFAGILIYNVAVRFLPFVLKKFTVFSKFALKSIGALILRVRKECVTL